MGMDSVQQTSLTARGAPPPRALARRLRASLGPQALASREKILLQSRTFSRVSDHRVIRDGCALDGKKCLEGFGPTPRLDGFFRAAEIVVRWSKPPICGHVVEQRRGRFAATLQASLELRVCLEIPAGRQIRATQAEATEPGIREILRLLEFCQRG